MTLSLTRDPDRLAYRVEAGLRHTTFDVTLDSAYPTGGYPLTAAQLGLNFVHNARAAIKSVSGTVNLASVIAIPQPDGSVLLKAHDESPAEVTNNGDLTGNIVRVTASGT